MHTRRPRACATYQYFLDRGITVNEPSAYTGVHDNWTEALRPPVCILADHCVLCASYIYNS